MIVDKDGKFECELDFTPATFNWFYQHDLTKPTHNLGTRSFAPYVGKGVYTCIINKDGEREIFVKSYKSDLVDYKPVLPSIPSEWNFSKLPKHEYPKVVALVKEKQWKKLVATVHNKYRLSSNNYCCEMIEVEKKFKEFVDAL